MSEITGIVKENNRLMKRVENLINDYYKQKVYSQTDNTHH